LASEDRYTFSQVMSSLIELESMITEFYRASAERAKLGELREIFLAFEKANLKRRDSMGRVRRETVIEMSLEPITGVELSKYKFEVKRAIEDENLDDLQKALALEAIIQDLYGKASKKVAYVSADTSELLNRLAQESLERKGTLLAIR